MSDRTGQRRVLLIEDDQGDILLMESMLCNSAGNGAHLTVATSLAAGIKTILTSPPDVVLLDIRLPDANRLEALEAIRAAGVDLPIIIITGLNDEDLAIEALQRGAQDYLVKGQTSAVGVRHALRYAMERHHLQQQLLAAQVREQQLQMDKLESLGVLAGGIAHDFNNVLMSIMGNISLAKSAQGEKLTEFLKEAEKAAARATSLTHQLLTFSEGGAPVKKVIAVETLIREAVFSSLRGANIKPEFFLPPGLQSVECDAGQIEHVIQNIMLNAVQAMPEGGCVRVCAEHVAMGSSNPLSLTPGDYVMVSFEDQGQGIQAQLLGKIFDPFFTTKQEGSGLGLAVAASIVQKHRGTITVDSVVGQGAIFSVYLPAFDGGSAVPSDASVPERTVSGGRRILVMDDDASVRAVVQKYLESLSFEVVATVDGSEALDAYRIAMEEQRPFVAVIADLTVPGGMGGRDLVRHLMQIDPGVRAIVSSGYSNDPVMSNPQEYGFSAVLQKPYQRAELVQTLDSVLLSRRIG